MTINNTLYANNARTTLSVAINTSVTTITPISTSGFPIPSGGDYFYVTLDDGTNIEIVKVTANSGGNFTVVRAQDGTSARAFSVTTKIENRLNAGSIAAMARLVDVVQKTGDTMTGPLVLPGNASTALQAVPKQQLDAAIASVSAGAEIVKWGSTFVGDYGAGINNPVSVTFPTAFPTICNQIFTQVEDPGNILTVIEITARSSTGFTMAFSEQGANVENLTVQWRAYGT